MISWGYTTEEINSAPTVWSLDTLAVYNGHIAKLFSLANGESAVILHNIYRNLIASGVGNTEAVGELTKDQLLNFCGQLQIQMENKNLTQDQRNYYYFAAFYLRKYLYANFKLAQGPVAQQKH